MAESDASLVARVRLGDTAAFEILMRRHYRVAYFVALAGVNNDTDAEDVCQDAFVAAWRHIADCREPDRFGAWLVRIVRNTAHNRRDYLRVRVAEPIESGGGVAGGEASDARALRHELRGQLMRALAELRPVQREIVLLHDLAGLRHAEIAERVQVSENMSRRHLSDARKRLRALLGDYATLEPDHD
ncbi:MAG: sigma-70 family RNA polymerase sigma factor [Gemmatimonadaceae bacterium]